MSVVIRKESYAYTWTCKVKIGKEPCNHSAAAATEQEARSAYEAHKKTTRGH